MATYVHVVRRKRFIYKQTCSLDSALGIGSFNYYCITMFAYVYFYLYIIEPNSAQLTKQICHTSFFMFETSFQKHSTITAVCVIPSHSSNQIIIELSIKHLKWYNVILDLYMCPHLECAQKESVTWASIIYYFLKPSLVRVLPSSVPCPYPCKVSMINKACLAFTQTVTKPN